jgi:hypothetical protein
MVDFKDAVMKLDELGLSDVVIPFVLVFTLIFAILQKSKIFVKKTKGEKDGDSDKESDAKKFNAVVALAISLGVVIPHVTNSYPNPNYDIVNIINTALPNVSVILAAGIGILLIIGLLIGDFRPGSSSLISMFIWIAAFGAIIFVFTNAAGMGLKLPNALSWLAETDTQVFLIIIVVFGFIVKFITGPSKSKLKYDKDHRDDYFNEKYGRWDKIGDKFYK